MPRARRRRFRPSCPRRVGATPHVLFSRRMTTLTVLFVCVCMLYAVLLVSLQFGKDGFSIFVEDPSVPTGGSVRTVTVQAVRGEIYDRNGKPLVTNVYSYDLQLDYAAFRSSGSLRERNATLLSLLEAVEKQGATPAATQIPWQGTYPDLTLTDQAADTASATYARLCRVSEQLGLGSRADVHTLVNYFVDTYELGTQTDGVPTYTNEEITALLRVYYDMNATAFGPSVPYTLAHRVPTELIASQKETAERGVMFTVSAERVYHYPGYATHVLGRVGQIFAEDWAYYSAMGYPMNALVGTSGCESAFETVLHGTDGVMRITLDAQGQVVSRETVVQPIAGQDIRLTLDIDVQIAAEDALRAALEAEGADATAGAVVAMHAETGELIAMASAPTYDAADFLSQYEELTADPRLPLVNRTTLATYTPGALMHPITTLAALSEGVISPATLWADSSRLSIGDQTVAVCPLWRTTGHTHGQLSPATALSEGCPVFFGTLGTKLDTHAWHELESALGIGQSTELEIGDTVGAAANVLLAPELTRAEAALGLSGAKCTPVQLCTMLSTILNGGDRYAGQLLCDVRDFTTGEVLYVKSPQALSDTSIPVEHRQLVLHAMKNAASTDATLTGLSAPLRARNVELGVLSASTESADAGADNALLLAFGVGADTMYSSTNHGGVAVCVVLEHGAVPEAAYGVAAATLNEWFE